MKKAIKWLIAATIILLPMLFFPFNGDHSQFIVAARALADGGKIFVDFIDLKPPFLYYCYWYITMIFGEAEMSCRLFDILIQLITFSLMFRLIYRKTKSEMIAGISIILYALLYVSLGNQGTFQPGMFSALATIGVFSFQLSERQSTTKQELLNRLLTGVIIGVVIGIKYTFGILLVAAVLDDCLRPDYNIKQKIRRTLVLGFATIIAFGLTLFPLLDPEVFAGFKQITQVLSSYATRPPLNIGLVTNILHALSDTFADKYSLLVTLSSLLAIFLYVRNEKLNDGEKSILRTSILFAGLLFFSSVVEKKIFTYHFVRMFPVWLFLSAYGLTMFGRLLKNNWHKYSRYSKVLVVVVVVFATAFSPIVRYVYRLKAPIYYYTDKDKYNDLFNDWAHLLYNHREAVAVSEFINTRYQSFDKEKPRLMSVQSSSAIINYLTPEFKHSIFGQSQFYFSIEAPENWQEKAYTEIRDADILLFCNSDAANALFGHTAKFGKEYSSYTYVFELNTPYTLKIRETVLENFELTKRTERYRVYERKTS